MMLRVAVPPVMPMPRLLQVMLWLMVALVMPMVRVLRVLVLGVSLCVAWVVVGRCWAWALAIIGRAPGGRGCWPP